MGFKEFLNKKKQEYNESRALAKEEHLADVASKRNAQSAARQVRREERSKQTILFARKKEQLRGQNRIKGLSSGGGFGSFLDAVAPRKQAAPIGRIRRKVKKKGGRRRSQRPRNPRSIFNSSGGFY